MQTVVWKDESVVDWLAWTIGLAESHTTLESMIDIDWAKVNTDFLGV